MWNQKPLKLICLILLIYTQVSLSQIKIGAKAGYSIGNLSDSSDNIYSRDYKSTSGIDFGVLAEFSISDNFSLQPEVLFTQRGGERNGLQPIPVSPLANALSDAGLSLDLLNLLIQSAGGQPITDANPLYAEFDNLSELDYMEVPVLAKYGWGYEWRFYVAAGPYFSFLLNAKQITGGESALYLDSGGTVPLKLPNPNYNPQNPAGGPPFFEIPPRRFDATTDTVKDLNTFNFGIQGGAGIIRRIANKHEIFIDARASYGFIPLQREKVYGKSKVGGLVFSFGYVYIL